jgi:hypothetical protein
VVNFLSASGKAKTSGAPDGFVKVILMLNTENGWMSHDWCWVTDMIAEAM